ncbi:hypothetical protein Bequi_10850 [Brachybacterium sp. JHP9]|uniref:Uncharacterized protein n=1 Tax=Brachybacterium equifaecis TaxID=2910770 RepID=A0ABT0R1R5_9MICO|nr:hypothetical protein [Brachybacterium equifaecis]MCL6423870.1 hypothetical protein [Brachybacterium equifaecis]
MSALQSPEPHAVPGVPEHLGAEHARQLIDQINDQFGRAVEKAAELQREQEALDSLVTLAYNGRAWIALGYASWDEMCKVEFSAARVIADIGERRAHVESLIAEGLSARAIGAVLSIDQRTVRRDLAAGAAHAAPAKPAVPVLGLDGKSYQRPTPADQVDRLLKVAQLRADGHTLWLRSLGGGVFAALRGGLVAATTQDWLQVGVAV